MSARSCLLGLLFLLTLGTGAASAREWVQVPVSVPECAGHAERELNCDLTACAGYGEAGTWADEVLVRFCMPDTPLGGPWLVEYVAFFMSGSGTHQIVVRDPGDGPCDLSSAPGEELLAGWSFVPAAASWPPSVWTIIDLGGEPPYEPVLLHGEQQGFCIGIALQPGDRIGLSSQTPLDGGGWGRLENEWIYDSVVWSLTPAVRVGLTDLGLSHNESSTWGVIKGLFR